MALTFYYGSGSPFAWKVWLALEHKQVPYELRVLSFQAGELRTPEYVAISPRHKVPAIVDGDFALYESSAIVEYLEDHHRGPSLWPADQRDRAIARRISAEVDHYLYPAVRKILVQTSFRRDGIADEAEVRAGKQALADDLRLLEIGARDFVAGALSAADYAVYPVLAQARRLDERFPEHEVGALLDDRVRAYMARIEALPYFAKTIPPHWKS